MTDRPRDGAPNAPHSERAWQAMLAYDQAQAELTEARQAMALARQQERTARKALELARLEWLAAIGGGAT